MRPRLSPIASLVVLACVSGPQGDPPYPTNAAAESVPVHLPGPAGQQVDSVVGCYRANRALGPAASPTGGTPTPGLDTFQLLLGGRVERPHVGNPVGYTDRMAAHARALWQRGSEWTVNGDSLHVRLSTGLTGWDLRLIRVRPPARDSFEGMAHYLTDVVVVDGSWQPPVIAVRVQREICIDLDLG